jgi:hypothetical protein
VFFAKYLLPFLFVSSISAGSKNEDRVWITRADGTLQCAEHSGVQATDPITVAKEQLMKKGIHILESKKRSDGKMHAQACGFSTGNETSFLIPKSEFTKAKSLGFELVR